MFQNQFYRINTKEQISSVITERLSYLGKKALLHQDVLVGALLLYKDSIIGEGYNTVNRDSNISCHAEINAINEAVKKHGHNFKNLDRDKLVLYSTYEPCEMCKGTILNFNIRKVYFEQNKFISNRIKLLLKTIYYNISSQRMDAPNLQEDLFNQHPGYKKKK